MTGLPANGQRIRESERLVTRILADHEYDCSLVGKLHLSPCADGQLEPGNLWSSVHHSDLKEELMEELVETMLSTTDLPPQRRVFW